MAGKEAQGDLRAVAIERTAEESPALVADADDIAGGGLGAADIAAKDPRVSGLEALGAAGVDHNVGLGHHAKF